VRTTLAVAAAIVIGIPTGWILTMLLTPLLWKLEPVLNMELAGHSGPSDWVFYLVWTILTISLFVLFRFVLFRAPREQS
jgi:hypothetical protein